MAQDKTTNKAFQAILLFSVSDRKQLLRFLQSPYFNTSQTLLKLAELFLKEAEASKDERFDRAAVWNKLFKAQAYNDTLFRKHCSDLYKQIEEFLSVEQLRSQPSKKSLMAYTGVVQKRLEPLYQSSVNALRQQFSERAYLTSIDYLNGFELEKQYTQMMHFDVKPTMRSNAQELSENLDLFYWVEKLKLCYLVLSQNKTQKFNYEIHLFDELHKIVEKLPLDRHPALAIYYYIYLTRKEEENVEHYFALKNLIEKYADILPKDEAVSVFDSASNYCVGRLNARDEPFWKEYLDLFKVALSKGIYTYTGDIGELRYNNTIGIALRLKEFDWVENFVEEYKQFLAPAIRENTYNFAMIRIYLHQKKFDIILQRFAQIEFGDLNYSLIGKAMLAVAYFEEELFDLLDTHLDSFKVFMNRHKDIPVDRKLGFANFIKYTKRLMKLQPREKEAKQKLAQEIEENKSSIRNFEWLLEKVRGVK
jgi:hypothetical protein